MIPLLFLLVTLKSVWCQVHIGQLFFPVTVAPPSFEIQKPDRMDTIYDETVVIPKEDHEHWTAEQIKEFYEKDKLEKWKSTKKLPPVYYSKGKRIKPPGETYKTDSEVFENVSPNSEFDTRVTPSSKGSFVPGTGIPIITADPVVRSVEKEPEITMTLSKLANSEVPDMNRKGLTASPSAKTNVTSENRTLHTPTIILSAATQDPPYMTEREGRYLKMIKSLEEDVHRLTKEVSKIKFVVNKLIHRVFNKKKNKRNTDGGVVAPVGTSADPVGTSNGPVRISAHQTVHNLPDQIIHTWGEGPTKILTKGSARS